VVICQGCLALPAKDKKMLSATNTAVTPPPSFQVSSKSFTGPDPVSISMNEAVSKKVERFKALATATINTQAPLKDRIQAMMEFSAFSRNNTITVEDINSDQALIKELNDLGSAVRGSDLSRRGEALLSEQSVFALRAVADGKPMAAGMIQHFDGLSAEDKQIFFTSQIDVTYGDGTRPYSSPEQYRSALVRTNDEQSRLIAGSTVGGATRAEKLDMLAKAEGRAARDIAYLQKIRGDTNGDTIQLSSAGALAAAKTLTQPSKLDGANGVADTTIKPVIPLTGIEKIEANAMKFLDQALPLKDRLKGMADFQVLIVTAQWDIKDPSQENKINQLSTAIYESDLFKQANAIGSENWLASTQAVADGKSAPTGGLQHWDSLSSDEKQIFFAFISHPFRDGSRQYSTPEQYRAGLARVSQDQERLLAGPTVGGATRADKLELLARVQRETARDIAWLQKSRGNVDGANSTNSDPIDLSALGAKAAAKTLAQPLATDGANDVALKALETLKQVGEQQREWAKSLAEKSANENDGTEDTVKLSQGASLESKLAKPGSILSIAA
jgi:ATP-dependent exoDNAse (exonuclease V) alpha subunit